MICVAITEDAFCSLIFPYRLNKTQRFSGALEYTILHGIFQSGFFLFPSNQFFYCKHAHTNIKQVYTPHKITWIHHTIIQHRYISM